MEMKTLVFDMDGTIADLYGVENWLHDLRMESVRPYTQAKPIYDMELLNDILLMLKACGWRIVVTSWLARSNLLPIHKIVSGESSEAKTICAAAQADVIVVIPACLCLIAMDFP